jgi:Spy/CpxP family protein refolding chaperone
MIFRGKYPALGLIAIMAMFCVTESVMAQPGGGRRGGGSPFGLTSGLNLLSQEGIQKELELVEDQVSSIKELQDQQRGAMREMFMGMRDKMQDLDGDERRELMTDLQAKMREMNKEFDTKADDVLLPHQTIRLKQLVVQSQNRRSGGAGSGSFSETMVEELGITDEQLEALKTKAEEVREKMTEKIAKIRSQAEEEVLSVLDESQRAKYKEMVGESYDFNRDRGGQRGRGGFGGGFGGGRRGGGRPGGDRPSRPSPDGGETGGETGSDF